MLFVVPVRLPKTFHLADMPDVSLTLLVLSMSMLPATRTIVPERKLTDVSWNYFSGERI